MDGQGDGDGGDGANARRHSRANTWSDSEIEEMYNVKSMTSETREKTLNLLQVLKAIRHCNKAPDLDAAITVIIQSTCNVLSCDRATLFLVDDFHSQLVIRQAVGIKDIRIPLTAGIAGQVYQTGTKLNIPHAYNDSRFNRETDRETGYYTQSILCTPVWDANGETVAVLQAINKINGDDLDEDVMCDDENENGNRNSKFCAFTTEDELLMDHLSLQLGIILRNHMLREKTKTTHQQVISLLDIVKSLHSNMGINSFMFTITERSPKLVDADRCTLYLVDHNRKELWSLQGAVEVRTPMSKGLAGYTASTGEKLNILDAHEDPRFNTEYDLKSGYRTKSVLVMPIFSEPHANMYANIGEGHNPSQVGAKRVVGVLQLINKIHDRSFSAEDEELLSSFLDIAGPLLTTSQLFASAHKKLSEFGAAADIGANASNIGGFAKNMNQNKGALNIGNIVLHAHF
uniref:GAF domain-containing protein n=1 Tax=Aplanochytrium stocchinoi TaxID=215587 RepID=A0A7S3LGH3_9STRA